MATAPSRAAASAPAAGPLWLAQLAPHLRLVHQISGRVRFKLDLVASTAFAPGTVAAAQQLQQLRAALPGVRSVAFNPLARSCVIEYDPALIPDSTWPELLCSHPTAATRAWLVQLGQALPDPPSAQSKETR
ncbi:MAG: hypothetical protein Q7J33_00675 [Serpentinimonas sp.]|jgi:hypothetical protein|nr:hypothetical protein [Serpentinimonas sp.]